METEEYVRLWLAGERDYTLDKFGIDQDNRHIVEWNDSDPSWWNQQLDNYYHRARLLGLTTPNGRQALSKYVATAVGMLEATVRMYGPLPEPGASSGYNLETLFSPKVDT